MPPLNNPFNRPRIVGNLTPRSPRTPLRINVPVEAIVWTFVRSSNVEKIGWDEGRKLLYIVFLASGSRGRTQYIYPNFPSSVYKRFLSSSSKGTFVWEVIRSHGADDQYAYRESPFTAS